MDVLVGPTFSVDVSSYGPPPPKQDGRIYARQNGVVRSEEEALSDSSSSSIGVPDDSEDDSKGENGDGDGGEEVESKFNGGGGGGGKLGSSLGSFGSLEESLPIKRGLSNYFSGKSKSFASLSEVSSCVSSVKEVEKRDNPLNKRRRVLIASKWSRKSSSSSSLYNCPNPMSMPLLALAEEDQEEEEEENEHQSDQSSSDEKEQQGQRIPKRFLDKGLKSFKSRSCYCLSDLQEHKQ